MSIFKIIYKSGKTHLLYIFIATFLSLFSYMLSTNVILSVNQYLQSQVQPLLGGDVVLSGNDAFDETYFYENYKNIFTLAKTIETQTTLFNTQQEGKLVSIVYRDDTYPLYGELIYDIVNETGNIIVDRDLFDTFGEEISIFEKEYLVQGTITQSPIGNFSALNNSSTIYLPLSEYSPEVNDSNARIEKKYQLKFLGEYDKKIAQDIKDDPNFKDFRITNLDDRNENIGQVTDRLNIFINFFNLIVFVLTFFISLLSLEIFYKKLKSTIGLLAILGLTKTKIFFYNFLFIAFVLFLACIFAVISNILVLEIGAKSYDFLSFYAISIFRGIGITAILLLIGVYSPFYKIYIASLRDLLSDSSAFSNFSFKNYSIYLLLLGIGFFSMSAISAIDLKNSLIYSLGFLLSIILIYIVSLSILKLSFISLAGILKKRNFYLFDAIRSTVKPGNVSFFIVFSSFISFISIFVFYVFSGSFISFIEDFTQESNDTFVTNISVNDIETTRKYFNEDEIYEIIPLRIVSINTIPISDFITNGISKRQFQREFFSTTQNLDTLNIRGKILESGGVSVDEDFSEELGVKIGDVIIFSVAGLEIELQVQNIRESVRSGANPFFYFSLYKEDFESYPKNYFVSYASKNKAENIEYEFSQALGGNVSFLKATEIIEIVLSVTQKVLLIIYFCLSYIIVFAFLTFIVSISFLRSFKKEKLGLLFTLGGQKNKLTQAVFLEYTYLLSLGFLFSIVLGSVLLFLISYTIEYFQLYLGVYGEGFLLISVLFTIMSIYIYIFLDENKNKMSYFNNSLH